MQNVSNNITRVCMFALLCFHTALCKTHLSILFFIHNQTYLSELCFVVNKNYFKKVQFYKTLEDGDKNLSQKVAWWSVACVLYSVLGIKRWWVWFWTGICWGLRLLWKHFTVFRRFNGEAVMLVVSLWFRTIGGVYVKGVHCRSGWLSGHTCTVDSNGGRCSLEQIGPFLWDCISMRAVYCCLGLMVKLMCGYTVFVCLMVHCCAWKF